MLFNWFPVNKPHRINNTNIVKHGKINNKMICWQSKNKWMNPKKKKHSNGFHQPSRKFTIRIEVIQLK